jgi:hypothetical protein
MQASTGHSDARRELLLTNVAPAYGDKYVGWLRPVVNGANDQLSVLMTWWVILFGLSMLARYYPRDWMAMLDVDRPSSDAVLIETMLEDGLSALPQIVLDALR